MCSDPKVGVPNKQINFIWTGRALGTCIAAVVTSFVFRLYFKKTWQKLTFLALGLIGIGFFILLVPWISSFALLLSSLFFVGLSLGCFDSADNSLFVYMLGPERSRPFIQSLHAAVALGFTLGMFEILNTLSRCFLQVHVIIVVCYRDDILEMFPPGSLLVHPFLPPATASNTVCQDLGLLPHNPPLNITIPHNPPLNQTINFSSSTTPMATLEEEHVITVISQDMSPSHSWLNKIPDLAWPFIIIAFGNLITATAFLVLGKL